MSGGTSSSTATAPSKASTGIRGLDEITEGGLPRGRGTLISGGPGTGKTVIALQTLVNGASVYGEPGIFVAFEEDARRIIANATSFGWRLPELESKTLFFLDARPQPEVVCAGQFDLTGLLAALDAKVAQSGARRVVFDAVDVLLTLLDDARAERRELHRLNEWLLRRDLTGIITCKEDARDSEGQRYHDFMQYMVDCALELKHRVRNRLSDRVLRVVKFRGSSFFAGETALSLTAGGAVVFAPPPQERCAEVSEERVSTGIARLDTMLGGGFYRGSAVLLSGAPGTAKTTLSGCFAESACRRGERTLLIGFDEPTEEVVRNLRSVAIDLKPHVDSGLLTMVSIRSSACGAEEHVGRLQALLESFRPQCMVIDPLSAIVKTDTPATTRSLPEQLLALTKAKGITLVCTSLLGGNDALTEATNIQVSTVADTWIHLSYTSISGERNRALTIIKSRGSQHSNQVRELVLDQDGISLADVYWADGQVLMGTARWQKEAAERAEEERARAGIAHKRRELELAQAEVDARVEVLRREMEVKRAELELLLANETDRWKSAEENRRVVQGLRSADQDGVSELS